MYLATHIKKRLKQSPVQNQTPYLKISLLFFIFWMGKESVGDPNKRLLNGKLTHDFPAVVQISSSLGFCSATIVGPRALLTAAHCSANDEEVTFELHRRLYRAKISHASLHTESKHDLALGYIHRAVSVEPMRIGGSPSKGDKVTLLGYGCSNSQDTQVVYDFKLRRGTNKLLWVSKLEFVSGLAPQGAALCQGDSGGPVLEPSSQEVVMGVNSRGNIKDTSWHTRLDSKESLAFFSRWAHEHHTEICGITSSCNDLPPPRPLPTEEAVYLDLYQARHVLGASPKKGRFTATFFNIETKRTLGSFEPYPDHETGVRMALGDVNGDGTLDVVLAPQGAPHLPIRVFSGESGEPLRSFFLVASASTQSSLISLGDFDQDGFEDLALLSTSDPRLTVYKGRTGAFWKEIVLPAVTKEGELFLATANTDADTAKEIVVGCRLKESLQVFRYEWRGSGFSQLSKTDLPLPSDYQVTTMAPLATTATTDQLLLGVVSPEGSTVYQFQLEKNPILTSLFTRKSSQGFEISTSRLNKTPIVLLSSSGEIKALGLEGEELFDFEPTSVLEFVEDWTIDSR